MKIIRRPLSSDSEEVDLKVTDIPDLWYTAMWMSKSKDPQVVRSGKAVLECGHLAHDMFRNLEARDDAAHKAIERLGIVMARMGPLEVKSKVLLAAIRSDLAGAFGNPPKKADVIPLKEEGDADL